ncbi:MAG: HPr-rel-A system PqqD family peptide chaperone [Thiobacillus sp.]|nr:HPr-rel-A system PqqD family peptide chaperone [Thiobacillus sp.]
MPDAPARLLKCWGDEAVVYDSGSGDTHYLKPLTLALYQTCRELPGHTADEICAALAERLGVSDTPQFRELTEDVLHHLRQVGLLETT